MECVSTFRRWNVLWVIVGPTCVMGYPGVTSTSPDERRSSGRDGQTLDGRVDGRVRARSGLALVTTSSGQFTTNVSGPTCGLRPYYSSDYYTVQ